MFSVKISKKDADKNGLIVGLGMPIQSRSRLSIIRLFNKLQASIMKHKDCPENFTVWPVSVVLPCRRAYVYKGPDDFPLEDVMCRCKNPKHRPVIWTENPSDILKDII